MIIEKLHLQNGLILHVFLSVKDSEMPVFNNTALLHNIPHTPPICIHAVIARMKNTRKTRQ